MIHCDLSAAHLPSFTDEDITKVAQVHRWLHHPETPMAGWVDLPNRFSKQQFQHILELAEDIRNSCDAFVICGIGGSYLGTRAGLDLLLPAFEHHRGSKGKPEILFAGQHLSSDYYNSLFHHLRGRDVKVCVVSKSGNTMETAVIFAMLRDFLRRTFPSDWRNRIIAITDPKEGRLRHEVNAEGYRSLPIPHHIGGRYSVLTAVGLLPFAVAGIDSGAIISGAAEAAKDFSQIHPEQNDCYRYALARHLLAKQHYDMEIFEVYEGQMRYFTEWLRQLFAESECKGGKGLFPAAMQMTTDLHSLGQFLQDGRQNFIETVLTIDETTDSISIPEGVAGPCTRLNCLNRLVQKGVQHAHEKNRTPMISLRVNQLSPEAFGYLVYFFQKSCAVSAALSGVNPFDQPGVEAYKTYVNKALNAFYQNEEIEHV